MLYKKLTIKQLKKPVTWILTALICMVIVMTMSIVESERKNRPFKGDDSNYLSSSTTACINSVITDMKKRDKYPTVVESCRIFDEAVENVSKASLKDDSKEALRRNIIFDLMFLRKKRDSEISLDKQLLKQDIYGIWQQVHTDVPYESVDFSPFGSSAGGDEQVLLETRYWYNLYQNDMRPLYKDEANNITVWYMFLYETGPIMFILIPLFLTFSTINRDKNSGVLKLLLTQSVSRKKYYMSSWLTKWIQTIVVIVIPAVSMGIYYGFKNGFTSLKYPVTYLTNVLTRVLPIPNFVEVAVKNGEHPRISNYSFVHMANADNFNNFYFVPHPEIDLVAFYQYALMALLLMILYVGFIVAVVQLISAMVNNEIMSLLVSGLVVGGMIGATHFLTIGNHFNIIPFNMFRVGRIIEGTQNVTVLSAVLILTLSTGLMLYGGTKYFEKKAI